MTKKRKKWSLLFLVIAFIIVWLIWGNKTIATTEYTIESDYLPKAFDGYRITQISDFHNANFGKENEKLLEKIQKANPDIIVLTGDLIDSNHTDKAVALELIKNAVQIAPCYFVTGNHEAWVGVTYTDLEKELQLLNVKVLRNEAEDIAINGETIQIIGLDDPAFAGEAGEYLSSSEIIADELSRIRHDAFTILLSHRPEAFSTYVQAGADLVFSGHAHGGQFRIPFVGGIVAPDQGFFPTYDAGIFEKGKTSMIVSRGIGYSIIPLRINNRPEIVTVVLERK